MAGAVTLPTRADLSALRRRYETELVESVVPFWTRHSPDRVDGGFYNCLDRDGSVYDTTKYGWLQGRQAWMLAKLYRTVDQRPEWLELALSGARFLRERCLLPGGRMPLSMTADGRAVYVQRKIFTECFYVLALAELARATGEARYARELTDGDPGRYRAETDLCLRLVRLHVRRDERLVLETVAPDGSTLDSAEGRLLNPGHAIEAGWFLQHWARRLGRADLSREAWPHAEALYAHLLNWSITRDGADWERFVRTDAWTFSHFPDPGHGEWYGYLDRRGEVTHRFKGGPYKGCFHVPRALWLCGRLLRAVEAEP